MTEYSSEDIMNALLQIQQQLTMIEQRLAGCEGALYKELEFYY